jgi:hypothetical protein
VTLDELLEKWLGTEGGAERANYQMFLTELTQALGLPAPDPKGVGLGHYQFEAPVKSEAALGTKGTGRIDLYKRNCFILEAKQSQIKPGTALPADAPEPPPEPVHDLFGNPIGFEKPRGKVPPRYDRLMAEARLQAERYALALPGDHRAPPFLIVCDIGRAFELYFDWSGNGRGYGFFPDRQNYRIALEDLANDRKIAGLRKTAREVLAAIWTDPASIDPRLRAAEVTEDIARRLSRVAEALEKEQRALKPGDTEIARGIEATSLFLMRMLFCMFAEDVELLPKDSFKRFLADAKGRSDQFWRSGLAELWSKMNQKEEVNRYWSFGDAVVRYFNGNLFASARIFDLAPEFKGELLVAAEKDWRAVEPAIFGTLLEQVLTAKDRARLGAHYTPRAYVERLVDATIMEVLRPQWEEVRDAAMAAHEAGDDKTAMAGVRAFHDRLVAIRVLDPACGTGNFLYVAMEELLRLEGEAIQLAAEFGETLDAGVHPNQFLGLELNPRAAVIAELVLWIGWLRHRLANHPDSIGEPVLPPLTNINEGTHGGYDAVLARTATGEPDTENPRRPDWPEADFIVGNPPFIGGKGSGIRTTLGSIYAEALWKANPRVPASADFVMQWWDRSADILTRPGTRLRRFGLVTTNSITQVFSRRVIEEWLATSPSPRGGEGGAPTGAEGEGVPTPDESLESRTPSSQPSPPGGEGARKEDRHLSLILAIPDHPWTRASPDAAAVRIAMTVAAAGAHDGRLIEIVSEAKLDTDGPELEERVTIGRINADLTVGTDVTALVALKANEGLSCNGMMLAGQGFKVDRRTAEYLVTQDQRERERERERVIRPYMGGGELLQRRRDRFVIDFFGFAESEARQLHPAAYQWLLEKVKPERDRNRDEAMKKNWWLFGRTRAELRAANESISRYIATTETAKHRVFQFLPTEMVPDHMVIAIASDDAFHLGVLSSGIHAEWALRVGGWLGFGNDNRYNKSKVFDPFPFPDATPEQRAAISALAEELQSTRNLVLAENGKLTMTGLYNLVGAVRAGTLPPEQEQAAVKGRARIVAKLHDDLDAAVAAAYGWDWPLPSAEIVARLAALNAERAAEEKAGTIRWLRPGYQDKDNKTKSVKRY